MARLRSMTGVAAKDAAAKAGWAEPHPVAARGLAPPNAVMVYAPRDDTEREVVTALVRAAHAYATGQHRSYEAAD